ncbi:MAG: serine hydrolase [Ignavibacteriaceae bacterium]
MKLKIVLFVMMTASLFPQSSVLDSLLQQIKTTYNLVGMTVSVAKNNVIVFSKGYGLRDVPRNLPMNDSTAYRIASISKTITAIALMKLYENGAFSLDDDISQHLGFQLRNPVFPTQVITIRKVLSHTSSLRDGTGYDGFLAASYSQNPQPALSSLLTPAGSYYTSNMFSSSQGPDNHYFTYSNINYGVIGTLIERLSNKRFDIFCRENIFEPMGLNASFNIDDFSSVNNIAVLYRRSGSTWSPQLDNYGGVKPPPRNLFGYIPGTNGLLFAPQGGLRISGTDLAKILILLKDGGIYNGVRILNDTTVSQMLIPAWAYNGSNGNNYYGIFNTYALGCHRTTELLPGETLFGHPGEAYGLISDMYFSELKDYGIVFITNGGQWGNGTYSGWYNVEEQVYTKVLQQINNLPLDVKETGEDLLPGFSLEQNYPNPFNPATVISYGLPVPGHVTLKLFDVLGNEIATLVDEEKNAGSYNYQLSTDNYQLTSGIYFYELRAGKYRSTKKLVLIK